MIAAFHKPPFVNEEKHGYDFLNGSLLWPPTHGIQESFCQHIDWYSYFEGDGNSATSILECVEDLAEYVPKHGPFDGVIEFFKGPYWQLL